jgi:hypothetical protein
VPLSVPVHRKSTTLRPGTDMASPVAGLATPFCLKTRTSNQGPETIIWT